MPFLWSIFFFILINNILGLVPIADALHLVDKLSGGHHLSGFLGTTATQNIFVTAALAIIAAIVINLAGIRELGLGGYLSHLTAGTKLPVSLLMIPIEIVGTVIKPVALALRLFANMTAEVARVVVDRLVVGLGLRRLLALHVVGGADVVEELRHRPRLVGLLEGRRGVVELAGKVVGLALVERRLRVLPRGALGRGAPGGPERQHHRHQQKDT